jgi:hypothetical protein
MSKCICPTCERVYQYAHICKAEPRYSAAQLRAQGVQKLRALWPDEGIGTLTEAHVAAIMECSTALLQAMRDESKEKLAREAETLAKAFDAATTSKIEALYTKCRELVPTFQIRCHENEYWFYVYAKVPKSHRNAYTRISKLMFQVDRQAVAYEICQLLDCWIQHTERAK